MGDLFVFDGFVADAAEGFPADGQVGGDVVDGGELVDVGVFLQELLVAFFLGLGTQEDAAFLGEDVVFFGDDAADEVAFPEVGVIGLELAPGEGLEDGVLEDFDVFLGGFLGEEAVDGDHDVAFAHEPGGVLSALWVGEVGPQESLFDVVDASGDVSWGEQELFGLEGLGQQLAADALLEGFGQGGDVAHDLEYFRGVVDVYVHRVFVCSAQMDLSRWLRGDNGVWGMLVLGVGGLLSVGSGALLHRLEFGSVFF